MSETNPRAFTINTVPMERHRITFVSMDDERYADDLEICPPDRIDRVSEVMDEADLTVVAYFIPEVESTSYSVPIVGSLVRKLFAPSPHYDRIAELGHKKGQRIGVADIANRPRFASYGLPVIFYIEQPIGIHLVHPGRLERYIPTPTDARRMLTAEAIKQEAERHPDGTHIAYIGAPAHVNRVARYITEELTWFDLTRLTCYHDNLPGLDKALRIYEPDGEDWALTERHDIVRRPMGTLATIGSRITSIL